MSAVTILRKGSKRLLVALKFLKSDQDGESADNGATDSSTPVSLQAIESGALSLSKKYSWAGLAGVVGAAGTAIVGPIVTSAQGSDGQPRAIPIQVTIIGGCFALIATLVLSIGVVISNDLRARGEATASKYAARATAARAYLEASASSSLSQLEGTPATNPKNLPDMAQAQLLVAAIGAFPNKVHVIGSEGNPARVTGLEVEGDKIVVLTAHDKLLISEIKSFRTSAA